MSYSKGKMYFSDKKAAVRAAAQWYAIQHAPEVGIAGATIYRTMGIWNGVAEFGFVLETLSPIGPEAFLSLKSQLTELAELLRAQYNQTSVLVTVDVIDGDCVFVEQNTDRGI